jgi:uncharacterized glyoxalase superfamily protein PhnB
MANHFQNLLFNELLKRFPRKADAVEELSGMFNLGKDAIYRRMRGDSILTPDELKEIATKYKISLDSLAFEGSNAVFFNYNSFLVKIESFEDYLGGVHQNLDLAMRIPQVRIKYASAEIPVFYYCFFPELMSFKLYIWARTVWNLTHLEEQPFSFDLISPKAIEMIEGLTAKYNMMSSTELWCQNIVDNTLNQIEFVLESGFFKNGEDALRLCDAMNGLTKHLRKMAESGKKFSTNGDPEVSKTTFDLYHNEMVYTNNTIIMSAPLGKMVFSTFDSPNFLSTTENRICDHTEKWFEKVKNKSIPISLEAEKSRNSFFNRLDKKVQATRQRIELLLEEI